MISFQCEIEVLELDADNYNKQVTQNIQYQIKIAASKFLNAALKAIPIFNAPSGGIESIYSTGFTAGAFNNLKDALRLTVGYGAELSPINLPSGNTFNLENLASILNKKGSGEPLATISELRKYSRTVYINKRPIKIRINPYYYYPGGKVLKTPQTARQFSTPPGKIFKKTGDTYIFNYEVNILYFSIQDVQNIGRSKYAPWGAFEKGIEAFHQYMLTPEILHKIFPSLNEFFVKKIYKVDTKGGISISKKTSSIVS